MRKWVMILAAVVVVSCTSIDCPINNLVRTHFQFTNSAGDSLKLTDSLKIVSARKSATPIPRTNWCSLSSERA